MKKILMIMTVISSLVMAGGTQNIKESTVSVFPGFYAGVHGTANQIFLGSDRDWFKSTSLNDVNYGVGVQLGYTFLTIGKFDTSIEGRYTWSVADENSFETKTTSVFLKPSYNFGTVRGYLLAGYSDVSLNDMKKLSSGDFSTDGLALGIGVGYKISNKCEVFLDYTANPSFDTDIKISDIDNEIITLGLNYNF